MEKLSDFQPIEQLVLPGLGPLICKGLVLVVGPNSSGKSLLLRDIFHRMAGEHRKPIVATEVIIKRPDYEPFVACLKREDIIRSVFDDNGTETLRPGVTYGTGEAAGDIQPNQALQWYAAYEGDQQSTRKRRSEFLAHFGRFLVTQLFLDRRLTSLNAQGIIDFENQPPQHDLHALYLNHEARERLMEEVKASFSKAIWPDTSRGSVICIRVSNETDIPTAEDRHDPRLMSQYRQIETEGDGFKSYAATCVALLLSRRPVCLIDEPELCLHPPQAYNLGKFIGRESVDTTSVTFVSTHSSHVLRGVIQSAKELQIVRLTRSGEEFNAHLVSTEALAEALVKPTVRAESVLDGIFSQAVVIVEADTDRTVYQAVWESLTDEFNFDIHFSPVGGLGGVADTAKLYKTLQIPVAVIADLDLLTNIDVLRTILAALSEGEDLANLLVEAMEIGTEIKLTPPSIQPAEVSEALARIATLGTDWSSGDDDFMRVELRHLAQSLDRMAHLKSGGIAAMDRPLSARVTSFLEQLKTRGLFLVPVGELEGWLQGKGISASKKKKWAWANEASALIRAGSASEDDVWKFVRQVAAHLFPPSS